MGMCLFLKAEGGDMKRNKDEFSTNWDRKCVICGKKFTWVSGLTCSLTCQQEYENR